MLEQDTLNLEYASTVLLNTAPVELAKCLDANNSTVQAYEEHQYYPFLGIDLSINLDQDPAKISLPVEDAWKFMERYAEDQFVFGNWSGMHPVIQAFPGLQNRILRGKLVKCQSRFYVLVFVSLGITLLLLQAPTKRELVELADIIIPPNGVHPVKDRWGIFSNPPVGLLVTESDGLQRVLEARTARLSLNNTAQENQNG